MALNDGNDATLNRSLVEREKNSNKNECQWSFVGFNIFLEKPRLCLVSALIRED